MSEIPVYDPVFCYNSLKGQSLPPCPTYLGTSSSYHCTQAQQDNPAVYEFCHNHNIYSPFKYSEAYNATVCAANEYNPVKCDEHVFSSIEDQVDFLLAHPGYKSRPCYCCCSCLAYGTLIAIPSGVKNIEKIEEKEMVLGGNLSIKSGKISMEWIPAPVSFSQGVPPSDPDSGITCTMYFIYCEGDRGLIASEDQLVLLAGGQIRQACTLVVGEELVSMEGDPVRIVSIRSGDWFGGMHHITINKEYKGEINGHLICANGFVVGDFALMVNPTVLGAQFVTAPVIGSKEYDQLHADHRIANGVYSLAEAANTAVRLPKHFKPFAEISAYIPKDACRFIDKDQVDAILANPKAHFRPFGNKTGIAGISYLFQLFGAFYPKFNFYLDWENIRPNAYAFEAYGQKHVVISGGLVRLEGLYIEGHSFIISHCIARLTKMHQYEGQFPLPVILGDYYGMGLMMPTAWNFNAGEISNRAIDQITEFWRYIDKTVAGGNVDMPQDEPSIDCRIKTIYYANLGGGLPACAKPPQVLLKIIGNDPGVRSDGKAYVILEFNLELDGESAADPANYAFDPAVTIGSVSLVSTNGRLVEIIADFEEGKEYKVTVTKVKAADGAPLDPDGNTSVFVGQ